MKYSIYYSTLKDGIKKKWGVNNSLIAIELIEKFNKTSKLGFYFIVENANNKTIYPTNTKGNK